MELSFRFWCVVFAFYVSIECKATESANIVGYANADHKHGVHVNTLESIGWRESKLGDIVKPSGEGAVLRFNDGNGWRKVRSEMAEDNAVHWFDVETNENADDYTVPAGAAIQYDVPDDVEGGLTFSGQVPENFLEGDMGPLFTDGPALNEIKLRPHEVLKILKMIPQSVTNKVVITNQPPSRFVVKMKDGSVCHARYDYAKMGIFDALTGRPVSIGSDMVMSFEIETNKDVAASARMNEQQVKELQKLYVREYRLSKDKKDQENAAKGVEAAIFSMSAVWKWLIGTVGAVIVGLIVTALWRRGALGLGWLKQRIELWIIKRKGRRLYRKTMKEREFLKARCEDGECRRCSSL